MQDEQWQLNGLWSSYQIPALVCEDVLVDKVLGGELTESLGKHVSI